MNSFKRKALTCAVLAGLGGVATTAEAVYLNPNGTGQVLIYPYYTVNSSGGNSFNTYISVTNTTTQAKATKVRFREGRTSAEVLDFNLFLSPNDVWVGAIGPDTSAADSAARLFGNFETSCTYPAIPPGGVPFTNIAYTTGNDALPGTGLDRTREGYVEIFDMATLIGALATAVTHTVIGGPPPNCSAVRTDLTLSTNLTSPTGGMYGEATIINVTNGAAVGYKADALESYRSNNFYSDVSATTPLLGASAAPVSLVLANNRAVTDLWGSVAGEAPAGAKAVAAVFMHTEVLNDYVLDVGTRSNTDWVVTFPGKNEFYPTVTPVPPYTAILTTNGACETALFTFFDRDEFSANPPTTGFSPQQPGAAPNTGSLCWESTVLSIRNSSAFTSASDISTSNPRSGVLGSRNVLAVSQTSPSFNAGWIDMKFTGANATGAAAGLLSASGGHLLAVDAAAGAFTTGGGATGVLVPSTHRFLGLPVTGFMVDSRANAAISCTLASGSAGSCSGNYMTLFRHSYRTVISP